MIIGNAWDRLPDETDNAYRAFNDYKNMGTTRSIDSLLALYKQQTADKNPIKPPTLSRHTMGGWSYKFDWPNRATLWDDFLISQETEALTITARALFQHELDDYQLQRDQWIEVYENTALFKQTVTAIEDDPENPGQKMRVITVRLNTADWLRLSKWRDSISMLGRRALNLPERITKQEIDTGESINANFDSAKQLLERLIAQNLNTPTAPDIPE